MGRCDCVVVVVDTFEPASIAVFSGAGGDGNTIFDFGGWLSVVPIPVLLSVGSSRAERFFPSISEQKNGTVLFIRHFV